ncbi:MAG: MaoC family dehydratase [Nitrospinae bacterium]|nr:MaoC family dehydratase [Nitrospinota bacterium]
MMTDTPLENLEIGDALPERTHKVDWEDILKFNRYVTGGVDTKNIHTDDEVARKAGLPRAVATGRHPVSFITELMVDHLGFGFITGGEVDVSFVKLIFPGDVLTLKAVLKEKTPGEGATRYLFEVSLTNQDGAAVTVGTASGRLA